MDEAEVVVFRPLREHMKPAHVGSSALHYAPSSSKIFPFFGENLRSLFDIGRIDVLLLGLFSADAAELGDGRQQRILLRID